MSVACCSAGLRNYRLMLNIAIVHSPIAHKNVGNRLMPMVTNLLLIIAHDSAVLKRVGSAEIALCATQ